MSRKYLKAVIKIHTVRHTHIYMKMAHTSQAYFCYLSLTRTHKHTHTHSTIYACTHKHTHTYTHFLSHACTYSYMLTCSLCIRVDAPKSSTSFGLLAFQSAPANATKTAQTHIYTYTTSHTHTHAHTLRECVCRANLMLKSGFYILAWCQHLSPSPSVVCVWWHQVCVR